MYEKRKSNHGVGFCFSCHWDGEYDEVLSRMETRVVKGVPVRVRVDYAICPICGDAMDDMALQDANEKRIFEEYGKKVGK